LKPARSDVKAAVTGANAPRFTFLGWVTGGHTVVHWYAALLVFAVPLVEEELGLSSFQVAAIVTVQMGVSGGLLLVSGYVADTFRRRERLILVSTIVVLGLGYLVLGSFDSYAAVLVAAALVGVAVALWHPSAMGSLSLKFPDRRGMALSVHGVGASVGDSLGPLIVGAIVLSVGWRFVFQIHFIPAVVLAVILWKGLGSIDTTKSDVTETTSYSFKDYLDGVSSIFNSSQAIAVLSSTALANMARMAVLAFIGIYFRDALGFSSFKLGLYLSLLYVLGIVSQPIMGLASDRIGRKWVLVPSFGIMAALYLAIPFSGDRVLLAVVIIALGAFFYAILNITQTAIMDVADDSVQASTMSAMGFTSLPFVIGSPFLAGYLVDRYGIESAFIYAAAAGAAATLVMIPIKFRSVRAPEHPEAPSR
jgi:MFS family permease